MCAAPRYMLNMETQHGAAPTRATVAAQQNHSAGAAAAAAPVAAPAVAAAASNEDPVATPVATAVNDNAGTPRSRVWVPRASRGSAHFSWRCMQAQRQRKTRCQMGGTGRWMTHSGCTSSTMPSAERRTRTLAFRSRNGLACVRVKKHSIVQVCRHILFAPRTSHAPYSSSAGSRAPIMTFATTVSGSNCVLMSKPNFEPSPANRASGSVNAHAVAQHCVHHTRTQLVIHPRCALLLKPDEIYLCRRVHHAQRKHVSHHHLPARRGVTRPQLSHRHKHTNAPANQIALVSISQRQGHLLQVRRVYDRLGQHACDMAWQRKPKSAHERGSCQPSVRPRTQVLIQACHRADVIKTASDLHPLSTH